MGLTEGYRKPRLWSWEGLAHFACSQRRRRGQIENCSCSWPASCNLPHVPSEHSSPTSFTTQLHPKVRTQLWDSGEDQVWSSIWAGWGSHYWCLLRAESFRLVWLFVVQRTVVHHAPLSMEFSRQEYWSRFPVHTPVMLPDPGIKPESLMSPELANWLSLVLPGKSLLVST